MTMTGRPVDLVEGSGNERGIAQLLPMPESDGNPVGEPPRPRGARLPDHLRGGRQAVRHRPDRPRRLQNRLGLAQPRDLCPPERQRDLRLRPAGLTPAHGGRITIASGELGVSD